MNSGSGINDELSAPKMWESVLAWCLTIVGGLCALPSGVILLKEWYDPVLAQDPLRDAALSIVRGFFLCGIIWLTSAGCFATHRRVLGVLLLFAGCIALGVVMTDR
jgi:hypothetical protein